MAKLEAFDEREILETFNRAKQIPLDTNNAPMIGRKTIGAQLYSDRFSENVLVDVFLAVVERYPCFINEDSAALKWSARGYRSLLQLLIESFLALVSPNRKRKSRNKNQKNTKPPVELSISERHRIAKAMLPVDLAPEGRTWSYISFALSLSDFVTNFITDLKDAIDHGCISFSALVFFMHDRRFSHELNDPTLLSIAAFLGPLRATTVEAFVQHRTKEFRQKCRDSLLEVERSSMSQEEWRNRLSNYPRVTNEDPPKINPIPFPTFRLYATNLIKDLKGEASRNDQIHAGWAHAVIKKVAKQFYEDNTVKEEHLDEVIWTVLAQRPYMKVFVVKLLTQKYNDASMAEKWKQFACSYSRRSKIRTGTETQLNPLSPNPSFLSIPESVASISFVDNIERLSSIEELLEDCALTDYPVIGLDAEWSSYTSTTSATILQLATRRDIFIVDIDAISQRRLKVFFDRLFGNENLRKIGYQFGEDLVQLRSAVPKCLSLYRPRNLICIDALAQILYRKSANCHDVNLEGILHSQGKISSDESDETSRIQDADSSSNLDEDVEMTKENGNAEARDEEPNSLPKGLSALCKMLLGHPLDKTEQCSVWDRRPLRDLQIRYAALDAYSMLMLYDKCTEWAKRLNLDINKLCEEQDPINVSVPLFCEED
ncbi:hypothetical protein AB6A40_004947 [Gnathostoma spinigerum]|uniref:3'-5' exonuclease domain-containing protein n=1 Tax=Gnathostoma spinigerum TaxID=75299 RepID=A0ABD6EMP8_9BILA